MMRKCKIYLLDDDPKMIDYLKRLVDMTHHIVVGSQTDPVRAIAEIHRLKVDILFLDMQMQPLSGMEVMPQLPEHVRVIFSSSYRELASEGYETYFRYYLLKPFNFQQFCTVLNQTIANLPGSSSLGNPLSEDQIVFYGMGTKGSHIAVRFDELVYGCTLGDQKVVFYFEDGHSLQVNKRIGEVIKGLPRSHFGRVSKNMFVALHKIQNIRNGKVYVSQGKKIIGIDLGPGYAKEIYEWVAERTR